MEHADDKILMLNKLIYGLVQAARQYHKQWTEVLVNKLNFEQSAADLCLYHQNGLYIGTYVGKNILIGSEELVNKFVKKLKNEDLTVTVNRGVSDYLSCEIVLDQERKRGWIGQPHMIKKIKSKFKEEVKNVCKVSTP